ncbi:MAG: RecX family transcriptional regulator [Phycisphaerales bacterium]|nr:RecX family transcriptional regulator [Phycisphaerales bacterium]
MARTPKPRPPLDLDAARRAAVNLLRVRDRSSDELRQRLLARNTPEPIAARVVAEFERARLINDSRLAEHTIARELEQGPVGRRRLEDRLARRMIDENLAARTIDAATRNRRGADDALLVARDLFKQFTARPASKAATKRSPPPSGAQSAKARSQPRANLDTRLYRRIAAALARRGFEEDDIQHAMDALGPPESDADSGDTLPHRAAHLKDDCP